MAENKTEAKSPKAKSKAAAGGEKSAAAKSTKAAAAAASRGACTAPNCTRALRAKGYCRKHFMAWRRGKLGAHHQYKICSKEACRKKRALGGLCAEHAGKGQAAAPAAS
jgi:hypothetical protein